MVETVAIIKTISTVAYSLNNCLFMTAISYWQRKTRLEDLELLFKDFRFYTRMGIYNPIK